MGTRVAVTMIGAVRAVSRDCSWPMSGSANAASRIVARGVDMFESGRKVGAATGAAAKRNERWSADRGIARDDDGPLIDALENFGPHDVVDRPRRGDLACIQ